MVRGLRTFKEFQESGEKIASNILAERLRRLKEAGIVESEPDPLDQRKLHYRLTAKGIELAPVLLELMVWAGRHEKTGAPNEFIASLDQNREYILSEVKRRWEKRDLTPLIPRFSNANKGNKP